MEAKYRELSLSHNQDSVELAAKNKNSTPKIFWIYCTKNDDDKGSIIKTCLTPCNELAISGDQNTSDLQKYRFKSCETAKSASL